MNIRTMTIQDYSSVYHLWLHTPGMGLNTLDDSRQGIERYLRRNPDTCFVAEEDGKIVGAILAGQDGRRGFIYHTAVHTGCRRRGIGTQLVQHVLRALDEAGIQKVALVVFDRNETGNAFWEAQGFTVREDLVYRNLALHALERIDT